MIMGLSQAEETKKLPIECPNCKGKAVLLELVKNVPNFGETLMTTITCNECSYRYSDVMALEFKKPCKFILNVKEEKDVNIWVIKSSSSTVEIPELEISIEPTHSSMGYLSTVEGVLERMQSALRIAVNSSEGNEKENAVKKLELLNDFKDGKKPFTLIIKDPFGNSAIAGSKAKKEKLTEEEVKQLKTDMNIIEN